ncbi:MAG: hypothetical protein HY922_12000 [Elusimicrobia bacterium]|nr:hypothetical protein [Elusimicrobiota bacterium]
MKQILLAAWFGLLVSWANAAPSSEAPAEPPANFELSAYDVVESSEAEALSIVLVFVGGRLSGQTEAGLLSKEKRWAARLPAGNQPFRFERWVLPGTGDWIKAGDEFQPRERFYRVHDKSLTKVQLKFFDSGRRYAAQISREDLTQQPQTKGEQQ